jgi:arginine decarboxylase
LAWRFPLTGTLLDTFRNIILSAKLKKSLGVEFDPDRSWDEKKEIYRISNKIVRTMNVSQSAIGDKRGLWTTVLAAAILLGIDE